MSPRKQGGRGGAGGVKGILIILKYEQILLQDGFPKLNAFCKLYILCLVERQIIRFLICLIRPYEGKPL